MAIKPQKLELVLKGSEEMNKNTRSFIFKTPKDFRYLPGQFLTFTIKTEGGEELTRSYSIASTPRKGEIEFCIKEVHEGGGSGAVFDLKKGEKVLALGPFGKFTLKESKADKVFIAAGTGIAPFRAMIPELLKKKSKEKVTLIAGFRTEKGTLYHYRWKLFERTHKNFEYIEVLSRPKKKKSKTIGHVQDILEKLFKENPKEMKQKEFYICGMGEMVKAVRELLEKKGVPKEQINFERYS